ncbi:sh3 domain containing, partial [Trichoderma arundinaceum]
MTRPLIVRADTIDLQDHRAPSAQDQSAHRGHKTSRNPFRSAPVLLAPHQAETLRDVAHETAKEQSRSPWAASDANNGRPNAGSIADGMDVYQQHQHQQDSLAVAQNGGMADDDDIEDDGDLDDDMMDRISSSPSIED